MPPWKPEDIPPSYERVDFWTRKERNPNDYRENPINEYHGFVDKKEEEEYWDWALQEENIIF